MLAFLFLVPANHNANHQGGGPSAPSGPNTPSGADSLTCPTGSDYAGSSSLFGTPAALLGSVACVDTARHLV
jgi:hypothetical protein